MTALSIQVDDSPVLIALLQMPCCQTGQLRAAQTAPEKERKHCMIPLALQGGSIRSGQKSVALTGGRPVSKSHTEMFRAFDSADTSGQARIEKTIV